MKKKKSVNTVSVEDMFKPEEFAGMLYNVFSVTDSVLRLYPDVALWDSVIGYKNRKIQVTKGEDEKGNPIKRWVKAPLGDMDSILKYVFFLYDHRSPVQKRTRILDRKKEWSLALSGLERVASTERVMSVVENSDSYVISIIVEFLIKCQPIKWGMLCSYEQQLTEFQSTLLRKTTEVKDDKDLVQTVNLKSALLEKSDKIAERITALYDEIFTSDLSSLARTFSRTSPEARALMSLERLKQMGDV